MEAEIHIGGKSAHNRALSGRLRHRLALRYTTLPPYRDRGVIYYWNYWLSRPFY